MATEQMVEDNQQSNSGDQAVGLARRIEGKYLELKEHVVTYPYVWASYVVVYGGFGLWTAYRWRKLRRTEDRVRVLQKRLRELARAEELASSTSAAALSEKQSASTHVDKPPK